MPSKNELIYPFTAIVGQELMKRAFLLNVINPNIGSILLKGPDGIGKATAARAISEIFPKITTVKDCAFRCNPREVESLCFWCMMKYQEGRLESDVGFPQLVEIRADTITPEEFTGKIVSSREEVIEIDYKKGEEIKHTDCLKIDEENYLKSGVATHLNRGMLFVENINQLDDEVVDILVDMLETRINTLTSETAAIVHPAHFILIGTINTEEWAVNPKLERAITIHLDLTESQTLEERIEIMERRREFESHPILFRRTYEPHQVALRNRITKARELLTHVKTPEYLLRTLTRIAVDFDIAEAKARKIEDVAQTLAAYHGRNNVVSDDLAHAIELIVPEEEIISEIA